MLNIRTSGLDRVQHTSRWRIQPHRIGQHSQLTICTVFVVLDLAKDAPRLLDRNGEDRVGK